MVVLLHLTVLACHCVLAQVIIFTDFREVEALIQSQTVPAAGSEPLKFPTKYPQNAITQFKACLWKQNLVYWRSPQYNAVRLFFTVLSALIFGSVFWDLGSKR